MAPDDLQRRVESLLARLRDLSPEERAAALDACPDPGVRAEVEWRLRDDADDSLSLLLHGAGDLVREVGLPRMEKPGDTIDQYRLVRSLGEGGMGVVWEAEQQRPIRRRVALKLIKIGMDTRAVAARFESERQTLALMTHPNVARVLDGGATGSGRPYFVMDLVEGQPLLAWCDARGLGTRARLELFVDVCHGVHHAHQKGVIHRDLKPSNVLVEEHDGRPVPKIIDFGIAKATDRTRSESTMTQLGQVVGTPAYMSPEQAAMDPEGVDIRTDVWSLGVMLYELVSGVRPFDDADGSAGRRPSSGSAGAASTPLSGEEIRRRILETDPLVPSRRASDAGRRRALAGDVDWITMKALEKDRARRYTSAAELAADLQRHLDDEPVSAGPPGARYRVGKFYRRHRVPVLAGIALFVALVTATAVSTTLYRRAERAQRTAVAERESAETISDFLESMLASVDPQVARGRDVTLLRELLATTAKRIDREFAAGSPIAARLHLTLGKSYRALAAYDEAERHLRTALEAREGGDELELVEAVYELGALERLRSRYVVADSLMAIVQAVREPRRAVAPAEFLQVLTERAICAQHGRTGDAEALFRQALEVAREAHGPGSVLYASSLQNLAGYLLYHDHPDEARVLLDEAVAICRAAEDPEPLTFAHILHEAALSRREAGEYDEAEALFDESLALLRAVVDPEHPSLARTLNNVGGLHEFRGNFEPAEAAYREVIRIYEALGDAGVDEGTVHNNLAGLLRKTGRLDEAAAHFETALAIYREYLGADHAWVAIVLANVARLHEERGDCEALREAAREYATIAGQYWDETHWRPAIMESMLAGCVAKEGKFTEAEARMLAAHEKIVTGRGEDHGDTRDSAARLRALYEAWGRPEQAARFAAAASP